MYAQYIAFLTISKKEINRFFRIWQQALIPPMVTSLLYFIIFGQMLGKRIGEISGAPYMDFIVPGLVMMQVISSAYTNSVFSFFAEKFSKNIEEVIKSPAKSYTILLGYVSASVLRGLMSGVSILAVASFFTKLQFNHPLELIGIAVMAAILFSLLGLINGIFAKTWDDVSWITSFVITPMSYLGGIFYSTTALPELWQHVSFFNPIFYFVDSFRYAMIGVHTMNPYETIGFSFIFIIVVWFIALISFKKFTQR